MIAKNNTDFQEAITTTYQLSQEEKIRMQCEAREDYYRRTRGRERLLQETILENAKLISEKERLSSQNELLRKKLAELGIDADNIE